jgi:hypothetical protein
MGLFKKIFKGIGKGFKWIGRKIMKGFSAVGKFVNKLGIFGQIGMALLMPGIMNAAFGALSSIGSGFMATLNAAAQAGSGIAKVTHAVLQGALTAGKTLAGGLRSVTETVVGTVTDSLRLVGNKVTGTVLKPENMFYVDPVKSVKGLAAAGVEGSTPALQSTSWKAQLSQLGENTVQRLESGVSKFAAGSRDVGRIATGKHIPDYQRFTLDGKSVLRDKNLLSSGWEKSPEHWLQSPEGLEAKEAYLKTPEFLESSEYKTALSRGQSIRPERGGIPVKGGISTAEGIGKQAFPEYTARTMPLSEAQYKSLLPEGMSVPTTVPVSTGQEIGSTSVPVSTGQESESLTFAGRLKDYYGQEGYVSQVVEGQAAKFAMQAMEEPPPGERLISPYGFPVSDNQQRMAQAAATTGFGVELQRGVWEGHGAPVDIVASSNQLLGLEPDGQPNENFFGFQDYLKEVYNTRQGLIS